MQQSTSSVRSAFKQLRLHRAFFVRHKRLLIGGAATIVGLCVVMIVVQLVYGAQARALPFARVGDVAVGGQAKQAIEATIQTAYTTAPLVAVIDSKRVTITLTKAGVLPDYNRTTASLVSYPLWQRFVPFSLLKGIGHKYQIATTIDQATFAEFSKSIIPLCDVSPTSAVVMVKDGTLQLTDAKNGQACTTQSLRAQFAQVTLAKKGVTVTIQPSVVKPDVNTSQARVLLSQAQTLVDRRVNLKLLGTTYTPGSSMITSWLTFATDSKTKQPSVSLSPTAITAYLTTLQKNIYTAPGTTTIRLTDGVQTGQTTGASGRALDIAGGTTLLQKQLLAGDGTVTLATVALPPSVQYSRSYSHSQEGLQALLNYLVSQKGDYAISVRQLTGNGWSANTNGNEVYTPASTYKLFVAYALLKGIDSGEYNWDSSATGGQTISQCFNNMIINSDNACAEWFGGMIGWDTITTMIHAIGLSSATSLYTPGGFVATANDEALFLTMLQNGQLLSPDSTSRLLGVMGQQVYRAGIPAGVGVPVADKVGFLDGLLHDAAIVYAPGDTYVLVIMTNNSSWAQIADTARQINNFLQ